MWQVTFAVVPAPNGGNCTLRGATAIIIYVMARENRARFFFSLLQLLWSITHHQLFIIFVGIEIKLINLNWRFDTEYYFFFQSLNSVAIPFGVFISERVISNIDKTAWFFVHFPAEKRTPRRFLERESERERGFSRRRQKKKHFMQSIVDVYWTK